MYKEKYKNAYMTIEASMVMPVIVVGIVFTIYLGFYLYNVCVIRQIAYIAALRGSQQQDMNEAQIKEYVLQELDELIKGRLIAAQNIERNVDVSLTKVEVTVSMDIRMPFSTFLSEEIQLWSFSKEFKAVRLDPVNTIRNIRKIQIISARVFISTNFEL